MLCWRGVLLVIVLAHAALASQSPAGSRLRRRLRHQLQPAEAHATKLSNPFSLLELTECPCKAAKRYWEPEYYDDDCPCHHPVVAPEFVDDATPPPAEKGAAPEFFDEKQVVDKRLTPEFVEEGCLDCDDKKGTPEFVDAAPPPADRGRSPEFVDPTPPPADKGATPEFVDSCPMPPCNPDEPAAPEFNDECCTPTESAQTPEFRDPDHIEDDKVSPEFVEATPPPANHGRSPEFVDTTPPPADKGAKPEFVDPDETKVDKGRAPEFLDECEGADCKKKEYATPEFNDCGDCTPVVEHPDYPVSCDDCK